MSTHPGLIVVGIAVGVGLVFGQGVQRLPPEAAPARLGETATISGRVAGFDCEIRDRTTFLTLETPPGFPSFSVAIPSTTRAGLGSRVEDEYYGRRVCVTGKVETGHRGSHVSVRRGDQLQIDDLTDRQAVARPNTYRPCDEGVRLPGPLRTVGPRYTPNAMRAKIQGKVLLQGTVGTDGAVRSVEVLRSLDPTGLDASAIESFRQWTFQPGTRVGQPVAVVVTVEMVFTLKP